MYTWHYDYPKNEWKVLDGNGNYVCSFGSADEARDFCDINNGAMESLNAKRN